MSRLQQAQELTRQLTVKNVAIPEINQFITKINKQLPDLKKYEDKFSKDLGVFNTESNLLKTIISDLKQNPNNSKYTPKHAKEQEAKVMKASFNVMATEKSIFSIGEKVFGYYIEGGNLLLNVDNNNASQSLENNLHEAKKAVEDILNDVDSKVQVVKNFAETNDLKRLNTALKNIETTLAEKLPPASEYYIYQKQNVWYFDKISQDELVVLKKEGNVLIKNITKEEYKTCGSIGKFPKGALDNIDSFISCITNSDFKFTAANGESYSESYTSSDGTTVGFTAKHQEDLQLVISFTEILLKAGLKGNVTLNFGKECAYGELSISVSAFYDISAKGRLCLKLGGFYAGAKASAAIGLESNIDFKTKAIEIANRKYQIEVGVTLGVKGSATASAEFAAELGINSDMIKNTDSIKLGEIVTHRIGAKAEAWAGVSSSIEAHANIYTDINNNSTKIIFGSVALESSFGIGAKIGALKSSSILEEGSNFYVKDVIDIDIVALAGGNVKVSVGILQAIIEAGGDKLKESCKNLLSGELRAELIQAFKECLIQFFKKVGDSVKASLTSAKLHLDASPLRSALISLQKLFASHNTVVNSQVTKYDAKYQVAKNKIVKSNEQLKGKVEALKNTQTEQSNLVQFASQIQNLPSDQYLANYATEIEIIKKFASSIAESKKLNTLAKLDPKSEKPVSQTELVKGLQLAVEEIKNLMTKQQEDITKAKQNILNDSENIKKHSEKFKTHIKEYQESGLKSIEENFAELYSTMINLPENPFDVSKDDKKVVNKLYGKIDDSIATIERTIDRQINFIIDLNTIDTKLIFDQQELEIELNGILDQMQEINKTYRTVKEELAIFIK